jgi:type VI secretion system protein ImpL
MSARALLRRIGGGLTRPGLILTVLAVLVALAVWLLGPLVGAGEARPLAPAATRLALILTIALAWGIGGVLLRVRRSNEDAALLAALRKQKTEDEAAADKHSAALEAAFQGFRDAARAALRIMRKGHRARFTNANYSLPWYLVLGEPGSGKTALARSATAPLAFDGSADDGAAAASFHVSDEAVLIELCGDLLNQPQRRLALLWSRMLDHVRRLRPQQPINGILVTASVDALLAMSQEASIDFAATVRRRIDEASARLRTQAPIYLVVTKLDLVLGFEEFFETLGAEERTAMLGVPLSSANGVGQVSANAFAEGFAALVERLSNRLMMRLQEEPDEQRRRRIFEFPGQFAVLKSRLEPLLDHAIAAHRFGTPPMVRGLFFTSATQSGAFTELTAGTLAAAFGQAPAGLTPRPGAAPGRARAFFLRGLVRDVLLPETSLSGLTRPARMLTQMRSLAASSALTVVAIVLLVSWWLAFSEGRAYTARLNEHAAAARMAIAGAAPGGRMPSAFEPVLDVLDRLADLREERPQRTTLGLYTTANVDQAADAVYDSALANMAVPFVRRYLTDGLKDARTAAALRFQQLKFYLMLAGERPVSPDTAMLLGPDFASNWLLHERSADADSRVSAHLGAMASLELGPAPAELRLVDHARSLISRYTLAQLAYDTALNLAPVHQLPTWRPVDHMGLAGPQGLSRVSQASFWDGIGGVYTKDGFTNVMLETAPSAADAIAQDLWVMGMADTLPDSERASMRIRDGVLDLYRADYITRWDSLLSDLDIADTASAGEMARAMAIIVGQPSPVKELALAVAAVTDLAQGDGSAVPGMAAKLQQLSATVRAPRRVIDVAGSVSEHFRAFRGAVDAPEGQQAQLDALIEAMEPLYRQINHIATGGDVLELGAEPQTLLNQLSEQTEALPEGLRPLFRRILNRAAAVTVGSSRERLSEIWSTTVLPLCRATTAGRYPFDRHSAHDASLEDFASLFGPTGAMATFRNDYLKPYFDSSTKPWRWRTGQQLGLGLDATVLHQFELADEITRAFFGESDQPVVRFMVEPVRLDTRARALQLDMGGPTLVYSHGPAAAAAFEWPPQDPAADAIMSITPELDGERNLLRRQGSWALFRLFDAGRILAPDAIDGVPYEFTIGSRFVQLELTASPITNPISDPIVSQFQCPEL